MGTGFAILAEPYSFKEAPQRQQHGLAAQET
jgi:hypothetical protein